MTKDRRRDTKSYKILESSLASFLLGGRWLEETQVLEKEVKDLKTSI